jgi:hypothetical protein
MLPPMKVLGLTVAAIAAAVVLAAASGSSCSGKNIPECGLPTLPEKGLDGGPDPCHCAPPPALNLEACPCGSGSQDDIDLFNACIAIYDAELDAGMGG